MTGYEPPPGSIPTLEVPTLDGVRRVHLVGIGGAGMRNLARLFLARGVRVTGSDMKESKGLIELRELGAQIWVGHDRSRVGTPDAVIISSAIRETNAELAAARETRTPIWARQQALAAFAAGHRAIAVAGTHGKTTTTSMLAVVLEQAGADPSYLVGGDLNESGSGARSGAGDLFLFEADESDGSFLLARPFVGIVTNVEVDHVDFYPQGREEIERAFARFMLGCAHVVSCGDDPGARAVRALAGAEGLTYGRGPGNDLTVDVDGLGPQGARGRVRLPDGRVLALVLQVDGEHNLLNATAALAAGSLAGVDPEGAAEALATFTGVHRRFEYRGTARDAAFYDDYGHTPTEMAVTLATARRHQPHRLVALVQPHRYSRVQAMWRELGASLTEADLILITDVYGAAQDPIPGVTGALVADGVRLADPNADVRYLPHRQDLLALLDEELRPGDLVVTMGCGDVWMVGDAALERIREGAS
jgi:UDP-N-acetylmuramate--alanine ligase